MNTVIVGSGLIGRSWAMVFARGGHAVALWDQEPAQVERALSHIAATLPQMAEEGLIDDPRGVGARISAAATLAEALSLIDVRVLDHLIVAGPNAMSFAERGLL